MTIATQVTERLAQWRPTGTGPFEWTEDLAGTDWVLGLVARQVDTLGMRLDELTLQRREPSAKPFSQFSAEVRTAVERITGLLEPLRVLEADGETSQVLARSAQPAKTGETVRYYELFWNGPDRLSLKRFHTTPGMTNRREAEPFTLTHEAVGKLVDDLGQA